MLASRFAVDTARRFSKIAGHGIAGESGMSDESSAEIAAVRREWKHEHLDMYLGSGGAQGHIMDLTAVGGHALGTHCLIRFRGRKSGKILITPLCYTAVGGAVVICASKGGADHHPNWYLNLIASPQLDFQIATQAFRAAWREPQGAERDKAWACMTDSYPFYADYQASTTRLLPLVMMTPLEAIPAFSAN